MTVLAPQLSAIRQLQPRRICGSVAVVRGMTILVDELPLPVGMMVSVEPMRRNMPVGRPMASGLSPAPRALRGEVIGFEGPRSVVMLFGSSGGIAPGCRVIGEQTSRTVNVGRSLLGRVINGLGEPLDGRSLSTDLELRPLEPLPTPAMKRGRITEPIATGVAAIDGMLTLGRGQRIGIFSGPGVGKSTLLASIARNTGIGTAAQTGDAFRSQTNPDVNVIALIGERGREVREFIEHALGTEGLKRSVVVVATGDESPLLRVRAAMVACTVGEYFRDLGQNVLLIMDSVTRFAQAQRQIGLAAGEQPATKGYTPSVFAMLPRLLERAGAVEAEGRGGSITGLYAVLVEGDELADPVADAARGVLDGHITLSKKLAAKGHFPAIDILHSISRVAENVSDANHIDARRRIIRLLAAYAEAEELINIGAYARGSNPECDVAIALKPLLDEFFQRNGKSPYPETCRDLVALAQSSQQLAAKRPHAAAHKP